MSKVKYNTAFNRDYNFYLHNLDVFSFAGKPTPSVLKSSTGASAKRCFHVYDSTGQMEPCREPELLQRLLICKASVNLNIRLWAQGIAQSVLCPPELGEFLKSINAPDWVLKAARNQGERFLVKQSKEVLCQSET